MTHGLLEHGPLATWNTRVSHPTVFMQDPNVSCVNLLPTRTVQLLTGEVSPDDVGNDSSGPNPLRAGCGRSTDAAFHNVPGLPTFLSLALGIGSSLAGVLGEKV